MASPSAWGPHRDSRVPRPRAMPHVGTTRAPVQRKCESYRAVRRQTNTSPRGRRSSVTTVAHTRPAQQRQERRSRAIQGLNAARRRPCGSSRRSPRRSRPSRRGGGNTSSAINCRRGESSAPAERQDLAERKMFATKRTAAMRQRPEREPRAAPITNTPIKPTRRVLAPRLQEYNRFALSGRCQSATTSRSHLASDSAHARFDRAHLGPCRASRHHRR